jgi:hypothetical protein
VTGQFVGERYGLLVVLARKGDLAKCRCDCGGEKVVRMDKLRAGRVKSCGTGCAAAAFARKQVAAAKMADKLAPCAKPTEAGWQRTNTAWVLTAEGPVPLGVVARVAEVEYAAAYRVYNRIRSAGGVPHIDHFLPNEERRDV